MSFVEIGNFKLPGGKGGEVMMTAILNYLDIQSLCSFIDKWSVFVTCLF